MSHQQPMDSTIRIVTPENIAFEYRVAGPFRRLPAVLLDLAIGIAAWVGLMFALGAMAPLIGGGFVFAFGLVALFVIWWFYGGLFEALMNGQTPGKWAMGLRVISVEGQPISGLQAVMRNILRFADMMPLLPASAAPWLDLQLPLALPLFTVGLLTMALNRRFQRLGDLVCGTMVVIEEKTWLRGVAALGDASGAAQLAAQLPPDFEINRSLAQTLAIYIDRRERLPIERRREVARHLAEPLMQRLGVNEPYDRLLCALYYRAFISHRGAESPAAPAVAPAALPVP